MVHMSVPPALFSDLQDAGYYPELTGRLITEVLFDEDVVAHIVHMDTHVDLDAIFRHVTVFVLTPTRLLLAHVDDEQAGQGAPPRAITNVEEVTLARISTALLGRVYDTPERIAPADRPSEVSLALSWGSVRRLEMFPETCGDPDCEADHGYGGSSAPEDVSLRVAAQAEGQAAVDNAEHFALELKRRVFEARRRAEGTA